MQGSTLIDVVEAAYRLVPSPTRWLSELAELGRHEFGDGGGQGAAIAIVFDGDGGVRPGAALTPVSYGIGAADQVLRARMESLHGQLGSTFAGLVHAGPLAGSALELVASSPLVERLHEQLARFGFADVIGVVAHDGHGAVVGLASPVRTRTLVNHARRTRFQRLAAHLGAAHRLRARLLPDGREGAAPAPEAVLTPRGKVVDASGAVAEQRSAREALVAAALQMERARGRMRREDPDTALSLWQGLVRGTWSLVESVERDGRRFLLAHDNGVRAPDPRALTEREAAIVTFVQTGLANKVVGYTLGLSTSAVGAYLASAMKKLRLASRTELIALGRTPVAFAVGPDEARLAVLSHRVPEIGDSGERLTVAEREVALLVARGLSNAAIAQARGRSQRTVANQIAQIFQKLGVGSRAELTKEVLERRT